MKKIYIASIAAAILGVVAYTQLTLYVVPPIGAIPEGKTVVMLRKGNMKFIDSPDSFCQRIIGGVSLLCRGAALAGTINTGTILLRLPYSETLFDLASE